MRVLVASDGGLNPEKAAEIAVRLAGTKGSIRLVTAIEVPRSVLESLRAAYQSIEPAPPVATDAEYVGTGATMAPGAAPPGWPGDDTFIDRYVSDQTELRLSALRETIEARGAEVEVRGLESEDATRVIMEEVDSYGADVLVVGSHGQGRFEGLLGSVGTKLVRRCPTTVVVCKS